MPPAFPSAFKVTASRINSAAYVTVGGELDSATAPQLHDVLTEEAAKGGMLVLDISRLEFIDSSGIRVLVIAWQEAQREGTRLRLTRSTTPVIRALNVVGLLDELPFLGRF